MDAIKQFDKIVKKEARKQKIANIKYQLIHSIKRPYHYLVGKSVLVYRRLRGFPDGKITKEGDDWIKILYEWIEPVILYGITFNFAVWILLGWKFTFLTPLAYGIVLWFISRYIKIWRGK